MKNNIPNHLTALFNSAVRVYMNPLGDREIIRKENAGKYGIYCWAGERSSPALLTVIFMLDEDQVRSNSSMDDFRITIKMDT